MLHGSHVLMLIDCAYYMDGLLGPMSTLLRTQQLAKDASSVAIVKLLTPWARHSCRQTCTVNVTGPERSWSILEV